jgi:ABC-type amino acid transport substrate-binding protein
MVGQMDTGAWPQTCVLQRLHLGRHFKRGELRIGLEVGYMPFEMIDKRSGLRQKEIRHGGFRRKGGRQLSLMGFDIDVGIEMAKALGVKPVFVDTLWPSIIPALNLGRFDIIFGGMSVTESRKEKVDFADPFMTVGQTVLLNAKHTETVQSYKDLNDSKFIVVSKPGTTGEEAVQRLIPKATYETAIRKSRVPCGYSKARQTPLSMTFRLTPCFVPCIHRISWSFWMNPLPKSPLPGRYARTTRIS